MIKITNSAQVYLKKLFDRPENKDKSLRLRAVDPNTPYAEASLEFINIGPEHTDDLLINFNGFSLFVDNKSTKYLEGAKIDFKAKGVKEELQIETPHLQPVSLLDENAPLEERVQYLIEMEVNPALAAHGGVVRLVEITENNEVILQFGGGCQGCGMVDVTLKQGIEQTLKERLPEITAVKDATDHSCGENPYY
ncbi:MAG: hypothetical protein A3E87_06040 [Gammaproteobacteria bacterium RIFCSPHIGHO2_12_FULL_35_23]|nr:MAG: hypothetical protein A3E87_06040 [Gammaproteobacteria bacterium RIFCSPHIGHO2_12_FULL_35_23]